MDRVSGATRSWRGDDRPCAPAHDLRGVPERQRVAAGVTALAMPRREGAHGPTAQAKGASRLVQRSGSDAQRPRRRARLDDGVGTATPGRASVEAASPSSRSRTAAASPRRGTPRARRRAGGEDRGHERALARRATARARPACAPPTVSSPGPSPAKHATAPWSASRTRTAVHLGRRRRAPRERRRATSSPTRYGRRAHVVALPAAASRAATARPSSPLGAAAPRRRRRDVGAPRRRRVASGAWSRSSTRWRAAEHDESAAATRSVPSVGHVERPERLDVEERGGASRHEASGRNGAQSGSGSSIGRQRHQRPWGARGSSRAASRAPPSSRSPFSTLCRRHAATTLLQSCRPPRLLGTMWSTVSACSPQYAQRCRSRARTARRVTGGMRACGGQPHERRQPNDRRHA